MSNNCLCIDTMLEHMYGNKKLCSFTVEQLSLFPLEYLLKNIGPLELLEAWPKLPPNYKSNHFLQCNLPCFIHLKTKNRNIDSTIPSQSSCITCTGIDETDI